jgi:O-antigen/teichoic acid export membrane protein
MSSVVRVLSASAAAWAKILLTILTQILLVPVFLAHWTVKEYGCWLIIQTIVGLASMVSANHHQFVGFEFLKVGDKNPEHLRRIFYSALPYAIIVAVLELLAISTLIHFGFIRTTVDPDGDLGQDLLRQASWALILYSVSWLLSTSVSGLANRIVIVYGYFPRMIWWGTFLAIVQALVSGAAVMLGAHLLGTAMWIAVATVLVNVPIHLDMWRLFRKHGIRPVRPVWSLGCKNVWRSLAIALGALLDISRQQGVRIFLGALVGVTQMTEFSTTRTMSNLSLQGIQTVTNPIMPEIMKFLRERDSERTSATIGFVWLLAVLLLSPVLIVFQWIMPGIFHVWTRGKIAYDPALFGIFSVTLLIYSVSRPPMAVLQGNNLLRVQLYTSILVSAVAVGGILLFSATFGVRGAALCLLGAECLGAMLAVWFAWKWLEEHGMYFPWALFSVAVASIGIAALTIAAMAYFPTAIASVMLCSAVLNAVVGAMFVRQLPPFAVSKMRAMIKKVIRIG